MPRVTIVVPVYNSVATVAAAIESALVQTFTDREIITVDDGSFDSSGEILKRYSSRIKIITQPNAGLSAARNVGVRAGRGEYLAFLDADDIWMPAMLEKTVAALDAAPDCVLAYTALSLIDSEGKEMGTSLLGDAIDRAPSFEDLFTQLWPIMPSAVVMRRAAYERAGGFSGAFRSLGYEDVYMWMLAREQGAFAYIAEPLVQWRFSLFPRPLKRGRKERASAKIFERLVRERWQRPVDHLVRARERAPRSILGYIGLRALAEGDRMTARNAFARAIQFDPMRFRNYLRYARTFLPTAAARALSGRSGTIKS
ncbi:MAG: glycosyltransferase family 2 protein [Candidatus Binataceae bacterium]